jgi:bifunctional non-homologous end joining protein LigD
MRAPRSNTAEVNSNSAHRKGLPSQLGSTYLKATIAMSLNEYRRKRDFQQTDEPAGDRPVKRGALYLVQKHAASHLHYDFRLELDGVLKSWAVPKGPSLDPSVNSLAVHVEDHPIAYGSFEGVIPQGEYGGGTVMLWDRGTWEPEDDAAEGYQKGKLVFRLNGERLKGDWALIRMGGKAGHGGKNWLLKKLDDDEARSGGEYDIRTENESVASGRTMEEIASNAKAPAKATPHARASRKKSTNARPDRRIRKPGTGRSSRAASVDGARRSAMPANIAPELPSLVEHLPQDAGWLYELKLDGYRMICFVRGGKPSLITRRGNDWTDRFPTIAGAVEALVLDNAILDGEIVALKQDGTSDFQLLQNMIRNEDNNQIVFFVFDLLYYGDHDLRHVPLVERKQLLSQLIGKERHSRVIRYCDHIAGQGAEVFTSACGHGIEGIVAKRGESHHSERRTSDWVKVKCLKRQEFVIGGWTDPAGARASLGALLVGYYRRPSELVYRGRVGTGFTQQSLRDLEEVLQPLEQKQSPFHRRPAGVAARGGIHWVEPKLVAEVAFAAWTADGMLRHASFQGIREDKDPRGIRRELPLNNITSGTTNSAHDPDSRMEAAAPARTPSAKRRQDPADAFAEVRLTHPDRILFADEKITKRDLAAYYTAVASFALPHMVGRPLSLLRCPNGSTKACFYQKHFGETMPEAVRGVSVKEKSGNATYIVIDGLAGLISLVQLGVLEIHPWGSREDRIDRPDRLIFDIDPAADVAWNEVVRAAGHVRERLKDLGLQSFVRTTGGKGLHVVAPIARRTTWDELKTVAKAFADALVRAQPSRYIAQSSKAKRAGKIFVDYLRNDRGATAVASYSTRARPGATVATPLSWDELSAQLRPDRFNTRTVPERLQNMNKDPWQGFFELEQTITRAMPSQISKW